jgi:cytochrome c553
LKRLLPFLMAIPALAQTPAAEYFEKSVRPVLAKNCYGCHGPNRQSAGINFATGAGFDKTTPLLEVISYTADVKMPPTGKLSDADISTLKQWVESGAVWPRETPAPAPLTGKQITPADRQYWAFQPIKDPVPPELPAKNPIDRFILAKLAEKHIQPARPAAKLTLLRRVTYDLTGLPPTPGEIDAFEADKSPDAFAKVVDRLLATPQYGERWGRHWLDVARFADSTGMDEDHVYPNAWRFRDYVVNAFNQDMPFDRFMKEQIAGDLLPEPNPVATGFLALGPKPLAQQDRIQMIYDVVDEQIDTTSKAFLGLTVACARCHDHKFDPILTRDYYALAGIFASTQAFRNLGRPGSVSYIYNTPLDPAAYNQYQTRRWQMYAKQLEMEEASIEDWARESALHQTRSAEWMLGARAGATDKDAVKWRKWLDAADAKAREGYLKKWFDATPDTAPAVAKEYEAQYAAGAAKWESQINSWRTRFATEMAQERDIPARPQPDVEGAPFFSAVAFKDGPLELPDSDRVTLLRREFTALQKALGTEPAMAAAVAEGVPVDQHVFLHGDHHSEGVAVDRTFPLVLAGDSQAPPAKGSGRLELANWLASPDNPLTARVIVNRVWQWHFGEGMMRTPNNWGRTGDKPENPELLDYLARHFIESGWSVKSLHRMILLSDTYQRSVEATPEAKELDPANRFNSRFNRLRMSVEELRDSVLSLSGAIDPALGGSLPPTKGKKFDTDSLKRRTLYIPVRRGSVPAILSNFDFGDATTSSEGRARTNVAPQALFVMNSGFVTERSREFAKRLLDDPALSDPQRVERAYLLALTRRPKPDEVDSALTYVDSLRKKLPEAEGRLAAWQSLCHVLVSTNEFLYLE